MSTAIGTYIAFQDRDGNDLYQNFQNFHVGETRPYGGRDYVFSSFGFSGAAVNVEGANIQATLVFPFSQLGIALFQNAADQYGIVLVQTVWLDPNTLQETASSLTEVYAVTSFSHNNSRITLQLGSPIDAVTLNNLPRRRLTQAMVGALPSTGNVSFV